MPKTSKIKKHVAEKNNSVQSSSNQKENRPKKVNINHDHNDMIEMSKQLMKKKKSAQKRRSKRKPVSAMKAMPSLADFEKMFEDSEEDLDDINSAGPSHNSSRPNHNTASPTYNLPQEPYSTAEVHANTEPITLNKTLNTLHDEVKLLSPPRKRVKLDTEYYDDDLPPIIISPSKKCTKISSSILTENEEIETCQNYRKTKTIPTGEMEKVIYDNENVSENRTDSKKTIDYNLDISALQNKTLSEVFSPEPCSSMDIEKISKNDELFAKSIQLMKNNNQINEAQNQISTLIVESSTPPVIIDYDLIEDSPFHIMETKQTQEIAQVMKNSTPSMKIDDRVSKEPSMGTVQTNETQNLSQAVESSTSFVIIDDSVIEEPLMNTVQTNRKKNLTQAAQSSISSVVIDDSLIEMIPIDTVAKIDNDIEIIEPHSTQMNPTNTKEMGDKKLNNSDDDDCVFVETCPNTIRAVPKEPEIIDLDYSFVEFDHEVLDMHAKQIENEIIDVDAIIALNKSILNKYKTLSSNNLVIDVNTSVEEHTSNQNIQKQNENQPIVNTAPNDSVSSQNMQSQAQKNLCSKTGKECEPIEISSDIEVIPSTNRQLPTNMNHTMNSHRRRQLNRDIASFFTKIYPNQNNYNHHNEIQQPLTSMIPLLQIMGLSTIAVPNRTTLHPQTSTSRLTTQATSSQRTQLNISKNSTVTSNSQKTQATPNTTYNKEVPLSPPTYSEKGNLGDCPICMDRLSSKQMASTICGHIFCFSCIEKAIKSNKRCPTCRKMLKNNGFHKIFL